MGSSELSPSVTLLQAPLLRVCWVDPQIRMNRCLACLAALEVGVSSISQRRKPKLLHCPESALTSDVPSLSATHAFSRSRCCRWHCWHCSDSRWGTVLGCLHPGALTASGKEGAPGNRAGFLSSPLPPSMPPGSPISSSWGHSTQNCCPQGGAATSLPLSSWDRKMPKSGQPVSHP